MGFVYALVDDEDYPHISSFKWFLNGKAGYAVRNGWSMDKKKRMPIYMHREILRAPKGTLVDHIDRNRLCNVRANLRFSDKSRNAHNQGPISRASSGVRGVYWVKRRSKYSVRIKYYGRELSLGYFFDKNDAVFARKAAELLYYPEIYGG